MPNITFNIDSHRFTFIKSQMGTGKTKHLLKELGKPQYNDMYIIAISFRKTFATDFSKKMNFANY
jgi:thymidine kinase